MTLSPNWVRLLKQVNRLVINKAKTRDTTVLASPSFVYKCLFFTAFCHISFDRQKHPTSTKFCPTFSTSSTAETARGAETTLAICAIFPYYDVSQGSVRGPMNLVAPEKPTFGNEKVFTCCRKYILNKPS